MIDQVVKAQGQDVTLQRCTVPQYDANDAFDAAASTFVSETVKAIVSQNVKGWEWTEGGRQARPALVITIQSTTDLKADREGRSDRCQISGTWYEVREVRRTKHPFSGAVKLSASLTPLPGR